MKKALLLILCLTTTLIGCFEGPYMRYITTERPKSKDVVGTYKFKEQSITNEGVVLPAKETAASSITLFADGHYKALHLPNVFKSSESKEPDYVSAVGKRRIDTAQVSVESTNIYYGISLTGINQNFASFKLMGNEPPYQLMIMYDDPSLGMVMIFDKRR